MCVVFERRLRLLGAHVPPVRLDHEMSPTRSAAALATGTLRKGRA